MFLFLFPFEKKMHSKEGFEKKNLWTRGQSGYPQVTCRGRVEALGIRIESAKQKVLPVRRLPERNIDFICL